jgi:molybdopterin/thiamine biosynthesis adenylyltransferase
MDTSRAITVEHEQAGGSHDQKHESWDYAHAFSRNLGLINPDEQRCLRESCVAIPGMGGVGGIHLITLARLGIGRFHIADPDRFDVGNFNRQYGADVGTVGRGKAQVMAEKARAINPEVKLEVNTGSIGADNVSQFLNGADVVVDGMDYFAFESRRLLFREARNAGIWVVTAGPIGFSTAWLVFDPKGMSFDDYFDLHDGMDPLDQFVAFTAGIAPRGTHWPYLDLSHVDRSSGRGPSAGLACHLASGVAAAEVVKILLQRGPLRAAPCYAQFDAYRQLLRQGKLRGGNRHPLQRLKRYLLRRRMIQLGFGARN